MMMVKSVILDIVYHRAVGFYSVGDSEQLPQFTRFLCQDFVCSQRYNILCNLARLFRLSFQSSMTLRLGPELECLPESLVVGLLVTLQSWNPLQGWSYSPLKPDTFRSPPVEVGVCSPTVGRMDSLSRT